MLFIRFCSALLSAYIVTIFLPPPALVLWKLRGCDEFWGDGCDFDTVWYHNLAISLKVVVASFWVSVWVCLEIMAYRQSQRQRPRLLTHLRYGPIAILVLSLATLILFDMMMIQYSRWQIVNYIHSNAPPEEIPSFNLHNNYRHWCGNGASASEYAHYGATPAAQFGDEDPAVRARALQASIYVYDWMNNPRNGPTVDVLRKALNDQDLLVRKIAAEHSDLLGSPQY